MAHKIEVYSAGGGITIAETYIDPTHYAVVSTDAPDVLSIYKYNEENFAFLPEDMVFSENVAELDEEKKALHAELLAALNK